MAEAAIIFTVGHSTRTLAELGEIVRAHGVRTIADVRLIPKSRRYPNFYAESLSETLPPMGLAYVPFKSLGGRRRPRADSPNVGWRNESFRGYADFLQTPQFLAALDELIAVASASATAIMCAEAVPWRCHRSLIGDALLVRGWRVMDIYDERKATPHAMTEFAKVEGLRITYPAVEPTLFEAGHE
jgi:uncharacterized protein (DUF488 family)